VRKKRFIWIALGLIALATVWFAFLRPRDEPKYQGRYLSEWVADYRAANTIVEGWFFSEPNQPNPRRKEASAKAAHALQAIGTNALPYYLTWIRSEPWRWQRSLRARLPKWAEKYKSVRDLVGDAAYTRSSRGWWGIHSLGSNAVSAIPELERLMKDRTKPGVANSAITVLCALGEPAIPVLQRAFADPKQADRTTILWSLQVLATQGHADALRPTILKALNDNDASVRFYATNYASLRSPLAHQCPTSVSHFPFAPIREIRLSHLCVLRLFVANNLCSSALICG
jgi:hypothetical protein